MNTIYSSSIASPSDNNDTTNNSIDKNQRLYIINTKSTALRVRSIPSTSGVVIGDYSKGSKVFGVKYDADWVKTKDGYSSAAYMVIAKGTVFNCSTLNIRSGAGTNYSDIGDLYKGNKVEIITESNGWYYVLTSGGTYGWVSSKYISVAVS